MEYVDVALTKVGAEKEEISRGYYDISIEDGDLKKTKGLETALLMSLFCEKRALPDEVGDPVMRRGWWGNTVNDIEGYEVGSKLWLLDQARITENTRNNAIDYATDGLQWLVDDNIVSSFTVDAVIMNGRLILNITLVQPEDITSNYSLDLWNATIKEIRG